MTGRNPDQHFVIKSITRATIADQLNQASGFWRVADNQPALGLTPDDPRLTDEFCQAYADKLWELDMACRASRDWGAQLLDTFQQLDLDHEFAGRLWTGEGEQPT